ncbi:MAG: PD40 domain-containing protein [Candidatus Eisenbacteria bacterium]|nr:PD40 domain-containing protein [Candidatus Eisenbacteria bacterium]
MVRTRVFHAALAALALVASAMASPAGALQDCRLMRQPDIQGDRIVFVYGGDLWVVQRAGGLAVRITSHDGQETFPKFAPDGRSIAFTGEYDGNVDAYTVPTDGGEPRRLTWYPAANQVMAWYPDGKFVLIRSHRSPERTDRFFKVPVGGGFEEQLPLPSGGYAGFSEDGGQLAFVMPAYDNRTWKRYRGGNAADIWLYDFAKNTSENVTRDWAGPDEWPMWHGKTVYYCSDRGGRQANLWAYDTGKKTHRQVTTYTDYDVRWPSIGSDAITFEKGGYLFVMELPSEKITRVQVLVPDDKPATRAEYRNVADRLSNFDLSPSAKRAVVEARGEIFTVPAEKGDVRNLTCSPGSRERAPQWSPDGKWIAYFSDRSGEYEIHVCGSDGKTPDRQVTRGGGTFRYSLSWSPDSKKLAFSDKTRTLFWCDVTSGEIHKVDQGGFSELLDYSWAPDSRWIAYGKDGANQLSRIWVHSLETGKSTALGDGMSEDFAPSFDPEGKYLFFLSRRTFQPQFGSFELNFQFRDTDGIYAWALRDSVASPVAPQSDEESGDSKADAAAGDKGKDSKDAKDAKDTKDAKPAAPKPVAIDFAGIQGRVAALPIAAGRYVGLQAFKNKIVFLKTDRVSRDADAGGANSIHVFDFDKREDKTVLAAVDGFATNKDGSKLFYKAGDKFGIVDVAENKKVGDGKVETASLMATVDPKLEFMQMFNEAWRLERDYYYDPNMGGLDWKAIGEQYRQLVPFAAHRSDLNYILGEMVGELSTSHSYVGGGDLPRVRRTPAGLLGADYELDARSGCYRFSKVLRERDWNSKTPAPLAEPGIRVNDGDYLLSVNGIPLRAPQNVYAAFVGTVGKQTRITVGSSATDASPRTYTVVPIGDESSLRYTAWVNGNRRKVEQATGGRIAYIHVPNTAIEGIQEFSKQYYPQIDKDGIIVDERFNGGGFIPDFFVERLSRTTMSYWSNRDGEGFRTPGTAIDGPKCILVNQYAGSGGDAFPYYFRLHKLGPVIGKRTWGGLVGISHGNDLVDGGRVTMPDFGIYDVDGKWVVENHGVDPDIEVENAPHEMVAGRDPQLERAIQYCMEQLKANPVKRPARPPYKIQEGLK